MLVNQDRAFYLQIYGYHKKKETENVCFVKTITSQVNLSLHWGKKYRAYFIYFNLIVSCQHLPMKTGHAYTTS